VILTDREIRISLETGTIEVDPSPQSGAFSSTSLDLTLADSLSVFKKPQPGVEITVDPSGSHYSFRDAMAALSTAMTIPEDGHPLRPGQLVLGWTKERVSLKPQARLAARVEGKSSLARLGLAIHVTAPTIHAGFTGQIQLEIINHGPVPIRLRPGMAVCQLIFESTLGVPEKGYQGQFSGQASRLPG